VRFSRFLRHPDESSPPQAEVPARRLVLWALVGAAIIVGLVLYFLYARLLEPLVA
jgi:type VI protein secretion system component VasF